MFNVTPRLRTMPFGKHLSLEEEARVLRRAQKGDRDAIKRIYEAHCGLVIQIAARYKRDEQPFEDLAQEGCVGLARAIEHFDFRPGVRFVTYATYWIRALILYYIAKNKGPVRCFTGKKTRAVLWGLSKAEHALLLAGSEPTVQAIAKHIGVDEESAAIAIARARAKDVALDEPLSVDGEQRGNLFSDGRASALDVLEAIDNERYAKERVARAFTRLSEREQGVIRDRFLCESPMTLEAIGKRLGVSRERVRQIEGRAKEKMRMALGAGL